MGLLLRVIVIVLAVASAGLYPKYLQMAKPIPAPHLDLNAYWGPGDAANYKENRAVQSFDIRTDPSTIDQLKSHLNLPLKLEEPLENVNFEYGFNANELRKLVKYWRDTYLPKWGERESYLKKFPHFKTQIQGLNVHFIHAKPAKTEGKKVVPLLLLHGWPGSVREFYDFIPLLTAPNANSDYVFEVVAPSLIGYGWSQGAAKTGMGPAEMAVVMRNLMVRLGHAKFLVQGGDWGSLIGSNVAALFPDNVLGYHSNMCGARPPFSTIKMILTGMFPTTFGHKDHPDFFPPFSTVFVNLMEESGYFHLQATKPDTIGSALVHNPVGLAGYIIEKFSTWTNPVYRNLPDGGLTKYFTLDALLDNVMIYYVTNSITTSQRLYSEAFNKRQMALEMDRVAVTVPTGCARFKYEIMQTSDFQLKDKFVNLIHSTYHQDGGHFAAMQLPKVLYADFIEYVKKALP